MEFDPSAVNNETKSYSIDNYKKELDSRLQLLNEEDKNKVLSVFVEAAKCDGDSNDNLFTADLMAWNNLLMKGANLASSLGAETESDKQKYINICNRIRMEQPNLSESEVQAKAMIEYITPKFGLF